MIFSSEIQSDKREIALHCHSRNLRDGAASAAAVSPARARTVTAAIDFVSAEQRGRDRISSRIVLALLRRRALGLRSGIARTRITPARTSAALAARCGRGTLPQRADGALAARVTARRTLQQLLQARRTNRHHEVVGSLKRLQIFSRRRARGTGRRRPRSQRQLLSSGFGRVEQLLCGLPEMASGEAM